MSIRGRKDNRSFNIPNLSPSRRVIESYTSGDDWYRLYDDGWVEQGGYNNMSNYQVNAFFIITLPIEMANANYQAIAGFATKTTNYHAGNSFYLLTDNYTTTTFNYAARGGDNRNYKVSSLWQVSGMSARGASQQTRYIIKY